MKQLKITSVQFQRIKSTEQFTLFFDQLFNTQEALGILRPYSWVPDKILLISS